MTEKMVILYIKYILWSKYWDWGESMYHKTFGNMNHPCIIQIDWLTLGMVISI